MATEAELVNYLSYVTVLHADHFVVRLENSHETTSIEESQIARNSDVTTSLPPILATALGAGMNLVSQPQEILKAGFSVGQFHQYSPIAVSTALCS